MGIVTSSRKDHFDLIHKFTNILRYFDFVLTADDYKRFKPDPEPYLKALARTGCDREECLVVEDSLRGLESAKVAGIRCIIVPNAMTKGCDFPGAYKVLERVTDIVSALS
jgi:HAD superfamily hydrolase (TIGR01509 family)